MDTPYIPTTDDLKQPRKPLELNNWILDILTSFHGSKETESILRFDKRLKRLKEELFPVALYAIKKYKDNNVLISPKVDNNSCDAEIKDLTGNRLEYVEVTLAIDGEKNFLELKHAEKHGRVPILTTAEFNKRKSRLRREGKNYEDEICDFSCVRGNERLNEQLSLIKKSHLQNSAIDRIY